MNIKNKTKKTKDTLIKIGKKLSTQAKEFNEFICPWCFGPNNKKQSDNLASKTIKTNAK